ncbi:sugar ABC transporter permease [Microbacterium sp. C7(2022)]|uniref:sugar ABC transporter permease n=1 Tax=Microbacterium sp. C7(2022) TaxID=2992759 RepID=UPI00237C1C68|nr:sugar ABC transporter permease [Microbacterium sp. C7(2022)]MDE0545836.1 sugar ABC transporter permease [Microbacterium sp. C7(2022)]
MTEQTAPTLTRGGTGAGGPNETTPDRTRARRRRWWLEVGWKYIVAVAIIIYAAFPLIYTLSAALNPRGSLSAATGLFSDITFSNFAALSSTAYWTWMGNSLVISIATSVGAVIMGACAAYAFSRFRFSGRRASLTGLLIIQMFPQALAFVAIFLMLLALGEVVPALGFNSKIGLICIYFGGVLGANTFLLYGFFNTIPIEIDESAKIDGASHAQIFWRLIMPLVTPILAVVALLSFIATYSEFLIARIVMTSEDNWTLAVGMYGWVSNQLQSNWGLFTAGAVLGAIPILILTLTLQRYIVGGLTSGAVKG